MKVIGTKGKQWSFLRKSKNTNSITREETSDKNVTAMSQTYSNNIDKEHFCEFTEFSLNKKIPINHVIPKFIISNF